MPIQCVRSGRAITDKFRYRYLSTTCAQNFSIVPKVFTERNKPVVSVIKLHGLIAPKSGRSLGQNTLESIRTKELAAMARFVTAVLKPMPYHSKAVL